MQTVANKPKRIKVKVIRTAMIGGGTSYDVYFPVKAKAYKPIAAGCYATQIHNGSAYYYRIDDFLRTPGIDGLPALSDERWNAFKALRVKADRLACRIAKRAFPELGNLKKLPDFWASWDMPSAEQFVTVSLHNVRFESAVQS